MVNHKYSTYVLLMALFVVLIMGIGTAIDSNDLNDFGCVDKDLLFNDDGVWKCTSEVSIFDDMRFPVEQIGVRGASNTPEYTSFVGNTQALAFDDTTMEQGFLTVQMPHSREENSTLYAHWHWSSGEAVPSGQVRWCLEVTCANIDDVFPGVTTGCTTDEAELQNQHQITSSIELTNTLKYSAICLFRIYRDANNGADNLTGNALLHEFDLHYKVQSIGEEYP